MQLLSIVQTINIYLSDYILVILLVGTRSVSSAIKTRVRAGALLRRGHGASVFGKIKPHGGKHESGMSSFQALATAVAAQVGTGNIVGACGAILIRRPRRDLLDVDHRLLRHGDDLRRGRPCAEDTRPSELTAQSPAAPCTTSSKAFHERLRQVPRGLLRRRHHPRARLHGQHGAVQLHRRELARTHSASRHGSSAWCSHRVIAAFIFLGGMQRIAFVIGEARARSWRCSISSAVLSSSSAASDIFPRPSALIFKYAFDPNAIIGGSIGYALKTAISQGVKRGLFSNEAGMGSTPHAHALANVEEPARSGRRRHDRRVHRYLRRPHHDRPRRYLHLYAGNGVSRLPALPSGMSKANMAQLAFCSRVRRGLRQRCSSRSACCSSRSPPSSAGTSSARSMWNISSAKRPIKVYSVHRAGVHLPRLAACPTTSSGSLRICSISSWSSRTSLLCLRSLRS